MARLIDAVKLINEIVHKYGLRYGDALLEIDNAPIVDAEPVRHGHWIKHWDDLWPEESTWECSLCHEEQGRGMLDTNYCPNCGAKMDGERREDDRAL